MFLVVVYADNKASDGRTVSCTSVAQLQLARYQYSNQGSICWHVPIQWHHQFQRLHNAVSLFFKRSRPVYELNTECVCCRTRGDKLILHDGSRTIEPCVYVQRRLDVELASRRRQTLMMTHHGIRRRRANAETVARVIRTCNNTRYDKASAVMGLLAVDELLRRLVACGGSHDLAPVRTSTVPGHHADPASSNGLTGLVLTRRALQPANSTIPTTQADRGRRPAFCWYSLFTRWRFTVQVIIIKASDSLLRCCDFQLLRGMHALHKYMSEARFCNLPIFGCRFSVVFSETADIYAEEEVEHASQPGVLTVSQEKWSIRHLQW